MVWDAIRHVCHEGPAWGWVQAYARQRDGRSTYIALKAHYMGSTFQARLRSKVDWMLETTYYDGTERHFSLENMPKHYKGYLLICNPHKKKSVRRGKFMYY